MRITTRGKWVVGVAATLALGGGMFASSEYQLAHETQTHPGYSRGHDWTVAPCTAFNTDKPIPAYTMTDRCVAPDGNLIVDDTLSSVEVFPSN